MVNTVGLTTYSELKSVILARGSAPAGPGRGPAGHLVQGGEGLEENVGPLAKLCHNQLLVVYLLNLLKTDNGFS